jgi:tetratricopeptide (TPR) repeat protein
VRRIVPAAIVFTAVGGTAAVNGGYFPSEWGWPALAFLVLVAGGVIVAERFGFGRLDWMILGALAALVGWTALSALWAPGAALPVEAAELALVYLAGLAVFLAYGSRRDAAVLPSAVVCAIVPVAAYSLATRLVPDHVGTYDPAAGGYLLAAPIGYSNALGLLCALAALVALGLAAHAERFAVKVAAAVSLVVLVPTLYFTFSRGAGAALVLGLLVAIACDPRRLRFATTLLVALPLPLLGAWLGSRSAALTQPGHPLGEAAHDGHRLVLALVVLAVLQAAAVAGFAMLGRRLTVTRSRRRTYVAALAALTLAVLAFGLVQVGNPIGRATDAFRTDASPAAGSLNGRLVNLSSDNRVDYWSAAWHEVREHPVLGAGGNEFRRYWLRYRPNDFGALNAHNLYLETLADLGPLGLALLLLALGVPLVAAARARAAPLVPVAAGAYVAFLAHAAIDWDWQLPAVVLAALACGSALVLAARPGESLRALPSRLRVATLVAAIPLAAFVFAAQLGNNALGASDRAAAADDQPKAAADARRARRWLPWSAEPWQRLGEAQLAAGNVEAARRSFQEALDRDPAEWSAWLDLAHATQGRERADALSRANRLNPRGASDGLKN